MVCAIPLGYTFGRIGNFLNGELYGRITTMPWGIVFPNAERFSSTQTWVSQFAKTIGMSLPESGLVNLPRHPSQRYEAFFEGIVLWLIIWLCRKHKKFDGMLGAIYAGGYGFFRFFIEYFRQPDYELGFRIAAAADEANIYLFSSFKNISTGQIFCFMMIAGGLIGIGLLARYNRKRNHG